MILFIQKKNLILNKPSSHFCPLYPGLHPCRQLPLMWWHSVLLIQAPHVWLHSGPYFPPSHSRTKNNYYIYLTKKWLISWPLIWKFIINKILCRLLIIWKNKMIKEPWSFNVTMLRKRRPNDGIVNVVLLCVSGFRFFYLLSI